MKQLEQPYLLLHNQYEFYIAEGAAVEGKAARGRYDENAGAWYSLRARKGINPRN